MASSSQHFTDVSSALADMMSLQGFKPTRSDPPTTNSMGGWSFTMESPDFIVTVSQDRSGELPAICFGSKIRRRPRAQMRGPWSLGHLRGFIEGGPDHYLFGNATEMFEWLGNNLDSLLDEALLNSDELNKWAVKASRRMFG